MPNRLGCRIMVLRSTPSVFLWFCRYYHYTRFGEVLLFLSLKSLASQWVRIMKFIHISNKGDNLLTIYFVPEHIYKTTFVYDGNDAKFSLEHCINDYLYEDRFLTRKQVRYNIINFEKYYQELG